ncbi:hypothetical protein GFS03_03245 [Sulfolobus sp. E5-1-F]|uniref:hypothetical protein n=1 Tax=Sulfolobaceae TaxID=118883 RepID=UPI0012959E28|nr:MULTISPECIES: hypothetical protein [unclassified Sulfolobus]QGA53682.1 hypothetical protein GFS03_03245 [Sulfolobus sp. E5-1-F]QGA68664.1 hypothetical protein GFS33_07990 [Sulfolobus sp. E11-6]
MFRAWIYQALSELSKGKKSIDELKKTLPLYGCAFDFVISALLSSGLAKRTIEGNTEYLEITDFGRATLSYPMSWHFHHRPYHYRWW